MAADRNSQPKKKPSGRPFKKGQSGNPSGRPPGIVAKPATLSLDDAMMAAQLERKGHSPSRIAKILNARPEAVKDALVGSRKLLEMYAPDAARFWHVAAWKAAKQGDHKPAMALLQSVKVVEPVAQTYDTGQANAKAVAAVKVELHGFTFAGLPTQAEEPKTIDVNASTQS